MNLFFRKYGEGRPVIILHGLFGMSDNWVPLAKAISYNGYCVYLPDLRNHGNSPHSIEFDYLVLIEDLREFILQHNIKDPVIAGHSFGGRIAMLFAGLHPGMIKGLIVIDIGCGDYKPEARIMADYFSAVQPQQFIARTDIEKEVKQKISDVKIQQLLLKNVFKNMTGRFQWKFNLDIIIANIDNLFKPLKISTIFPEKCLFIAAEKSDLISNNEISLLLHWFPQVSFQTIPGASHWIHTTHMHELTEVINNFLIESR